MKVLFTLRLKREGHQSQTSSFQMTLDFFGQRVTDQEFFAQAVIEREIFSSTESLRKSSLRRKPASYRFRKLSLVIR